jgi:hypothetical protein
MFRNGCVDANTVNQIRLFTAWWCSMLCFMQATLICNQTITFWRNPWNIAAICSAVWWQISGHHAILKETPQQFPWVLDSLLSLEDKKLESLSWFRSSWMWHNVAELVFPRNAVTLSSKDEAPLKCQETLSQQHSITCQKTLLRNSTAVEISNLEQTCYFP